MKTAKRRKLPPISDVEEARIQAGIALDPDNPEWTAEDFAKARPAREVLPPELYAALVKNQRQAARKSSATLVPVDIDVEVVEKFRATGPGWQSRINEALRKAAGLKKAR